MRARSGPPVRCCVGAATTPANSASATTTPRWGGSPATSRARFTARSVRRCDPPDNLDDYKTEFGYLGPALHAAVVKARSTPLPVTTASSSLTSSKPLSSTSSVFPSVSNILLYICPLFVWTSPRTYMFLERFCGRTCMSLPVQSSYAASTAVPTVSRTVIH